MTNATQNFELSVKSSEKGSLLCIKGTKTKKTIFTASESEKLFQFFQQKDGPTNIKIRKGATVACDFC